MKSVHQKASLVCMLTATLGLIMIGQVTGQSFRTLHSFSGSTANSSGDYTNSDGGLPLCSLIPSGNTLYGTTSAGGSGGSGTVFAVNTDGSGFTNLHSFTAGTGGFHINSDGINPYAGLILSGNTLYGTAVGGGSSGRGTVFAVNTDGTGFTNLHDFPATSGPGGSNSDGASPYAGLILSGNTLYGTAFGGGSSGNGTVFAINTDGTGFTNLHDFPATSGPGSTNSDGINPYAGLILSGNTLYGTAVGGGSKNSGTVFAINTDGTGFTNLHSFGNSTSRDRDGASPYAGLTLSDNTLYGTTFTGGNSVSGTVFAINTGGTGITNLYNFRPCDVGDCSDGGYPVAGLILSGDTLYGTAWRNSGTVFSVRTNGTGFVTLWSFNGSEGDQPRGGLVLSGNSLYGTAYGGGIGGNGTVFSLSFTPELAIISSGGNVILSWPTHYAGFDYTSFTLQSTTNLGSSAIWTTNLPPPVVVNGQYTVTNPITGRQQFFRLSQ